MSSPARRFAARLHALNRSPALPIQNRGLSFSSPKAKDDKNDNTTKSGSKHATKPNQTQTKQPSTSKLNAPYDLNTPSIWKRSKAHSPEIIFTKSTISSSDDKYDFGTSPVGEDIAHLERVWKRSKGEPILEPPSEKSVKSIHTHSEQVKDEKQITVQSEVDDGGPKYVAYGPLFWNAEKRKKEKKAKEEAERKKKEEEEVDEARDEEGKK